MTRIKVCGITSLKDALLAAEAGADAAGFIFAESPRKIDPEQAKEIIRSLPPFLVKVGVFVNEKIDVVRAIHDHCGLNLVQLHGEEDQYYLDALALSSIKAFRVRDHHDLIGLSEFKSEYFLLDAFYGNLRGGAGKVFDWGIVAEAKRFGKVILSGGLNAENVGSALQKTNPYAVDVCSGVEKKPGIKDPEKLRRFIREVKEWDYRTN